MFQDKAAPLQQQRHGVSPSANPIRAVPPLTLRLARALPPAVAELVRRSIEELSLDRPLNDPNIATISVGVAAAAQAKDWDGTSSLMSAADEALYGAKGAGRNRVGFACISSEPGP
jgi:GGDEF domain-containing protein